MRGFHPEDSCMKKTLNQMKDLCVQNNISLTQGVEMSDDGYQIEEYERCLHASLTLLKAYLIDSGASNHMVSSRESFITFPLSRGPNSHMGDDSKIPAIERGANKIQHDEFMPSTTARRKANC